MTSPVSRLSVADMPERHRFEIRDGERVAAFTQYTRRRGEIAFLHTETDPE